MQAYVTLLPNFLMYFAVTAMFTLLFVTVYLWSTPYREIELIRNGNIAASIKLGGAMLGFALPLASVVKHSLDLADLSIWAATALLIQLGVYQGLRLIYRDLADLIVANNVSVGVLCAFAAIVVGLLNAACLTF